MGANFLQRRGVLLLSSACLALTVLSYLVSHQLTADTALVRCLVSLSAIGSHDFPRAEESVGEHGRARTGPTLDLTHDTVFVRDMNDIITYWNRGAEELYGWRRDEAIGQVSHRLMKTVFPCIPGKDHGRAVPHRSVGRRTRPHEARRDSRDRGEPMVFAGRRADGRSQQWRPITTLRNTSGPTPSCARANAGTETFSRRQVYRSGKRTFPRSRQPLTNSRLRASGTSDTISRHTRNLSGKPSRWCGSSTSTKRRSSCLRLGGRRTCSSLCTRSFCRSPRTCLRKC